jgi:hypothetical protein
MMPVRSLPSLYKFTYKLNRISSHHVFLDQTVSLDRFPHDPLSGRLQESSPYFVSIVENALLTQLVYR